MLRAQTVDDVLLLESLLQQIDVLRLVGLVESSHVWKRVGSPVSRPMSSSP